MKTLILVVVAILSLNVLGALAFSSGPPPGYAMDLPAVNNCTACHSDFPINSGNGAFNFTNLGTYVPGETYLIQVTLEDPDQFRWGFQMTAKDDNFDFAGNFQPLDGFTQLNSGYINHTQAGTFSGATSAVWEFEWVAPPAGTGTVTMTASGNAANGNSSTSGDYIYWTGFGIDEGTAPLYDLIATPIVDQVPSSGGTITYSLEFYMNLPNPVQGVSYWTTALLPNGDEVGPLMRIVTNIPAFADIFIPEMSQDIPDFAPDGEYTHISKMGFFPNSMLESSFMFTKGGVAVNRELPVNSWAASGTWPGAKQFSETGTLAQQPAAFTMGQAYPNPFNASTSFTVHLPETADLTVTAYNIQGQVVEVLLMGEIPGGGHRLSLSAEHLPSGIYFIHAKVPGKMNEVRKVTILK